MDIFLLTVAVRAGENLFTFIFLLKRLASVSIPIILQDYAFPKLFNQFRLNSSSHLSRIFLNLQRLLLSTKK